MMRTVIAYLLIAVLLAGVAWLLVGYRDRKRERARLRGEWPKRRHPRR